MGVFMIRVPDDNDVVMFEGSFISGKQTLIIRELKQFLQECFYKHPNYNKYINRLIHEGMSCQIMTTDSPGWKRGRVKIVFQIEIDE